MTELQNQNFSDTELWLPVTRYPKEPQLGIFDNLTLKILLGGSSSDVDPAILNRESTFIGNYVGLDPTIKPYYELLYGYNFMTFRDTSRATPPGSPKAFINLILSSRVLKKKFNNLLTELRVLCFPKTSVQNMGVQNTRVPRLHSQSPNDDNNNRQFSPSDANEGEHLRRPNYA